MNQTLPVPQSDAFPHEDCLVIRDVTVAYSVRSC